MHEAAIARGCVSLTRAALPLAKWHMESAWRFPTPGVDLKLCAQRPSMAKVSESGKPPRLHSDWPSPERILVCVGPAPSSDRLIRAAARMAADLRCPWIAAYVDSVARETLTKADRARLENHLRNAEALGATAARLTGQRVAATLVAYARQRNVTRIVIGKPTHSRLRDRLRGSLLNEVVRGSGAIDVHLLNGDEATAALKTADSSPARRAPLWQHLSAAVIVLTTLGIAVL